MLNDQQQPPVIFLMGPTASGKTQLAIELVQQLQGQIISVDSAMIYRGMDIGTAKPEAHELALAPHKLIDICDPSEAYSAAQFRRDALQYIDDCYKNGKWPILVGGTMLYFKALFEGLAQLPPSDPEVRETLRLKMENEGVASLHQWLQQVDAVTAQRLHPNDPQRVTRALEVYLISGKPLSEFHQQQSEQTFPYPVCQFALAPQNRSLLHQRIEQRFDTMLQAGFEQEVAELMARNDLNGDMPSIKCVGYRQMWSYLSGELTLSEARYRGIVATRQLAKRQFTWLRSWSNIHWLDSLAKDNCAHVLKKLVNIAI